jgi:membrane-bound lytic murein transglycosylase D
MAYNCGEGRLQKAIRKAGTDDLSVLLDDRAAYLPKETRNYIKKILMVAMIGENASLGLEKSKRVKDAVVKMYGENVVQVEVEPGESLEEIARIIHMKPKDLLKLNHHFKDGVVPVKLPQYKMNIPNLKVVDFYAVYRLQKELKKYSKTHYLSHVVQPGESLDKIAKKYSTTVGEIVLYNPVKRKRLELGQVLVIPVTKEVFLAFSSQHG